VAGSPADKIKAFKHLFNESFFSTHNFSIFAQNTAGV